MKKALQSLQNLSLIKKYILQFILVGVIPITVIFLIAVNRIGTDAMNMQLYMLNQGYEQTTISIEGMIERMANTSMQVNVNEDVRNTLKQDPKSIPISNQLKMFENISSFSYGLEFSMGNSNILYYIDDAFAIAYSASTRYRPISSLEDNELAKRLYKLGGKPIWGVMEERTKYGKTTDYLVNMHILWNNDDYNKMLGVIGVLTEVHTVSKMLVASVEEQIVYLEDKDGNLIISNTEVDENFRKTVYGRTSGSFRKIKLNEKPYLVRSEMLENEEIYLVSLLPYSVLNSDMKETLGGILYAYVIVIIMAVLFMVLLSKNMIKRIKLLDKTMLKNGKPLRLETRNYDDEIGRLITSYNNMVDTIDELMEKQYTLGHEKVDAQLKALQSQINPHFLYNTMDMINWMAQKGETGNIQTVLQAMSKFYRMALSKGKDIVTIENEIRMCEAYIEIQTMRFRGKIVFEVDIQEDILNYRIPKITLQPFIENAILHGICNKSSGRGVIVVNGWIEDERIVLSVTDDGVGMNEKTSDNKEGSNYGLKNIEKRLSLFYQEDITIHVESSMGIGTCVYINIPMVLEWEGDVDFS